MSSVAVRYVAARAAPPVARAASRFTAREIAAFKAGSWAAVPIDYALENKVIPYIEKHVTKKAIIQKYKAQKKRLMTIPYRARSAISRARGRGYNRRLTGEPMVISQTTVSEKRSRSRSVPRSRSSRNDVSWRT